MDDAKMLLRYDANKKSVGLAYALWLLLGVLGAHRFYAGKVMTGLMMLAGTVTSFLLSFVMIGYLTIIPILIWVLVDVFFVGSWIRAFNLELIDRLK